MPIDLLAGNPKDASGKLLRGEVRTSDRAPVDLLSGYAPTPQRAAPRRVPPTTLDKITNFLERGAEPFRPIQRAVAGAGLGFEQGLANVPYGAMELISEGAGKVGYPFHNPVHKFDFAPHTAAATLGNMASFFAGPGMVKGIIGGARLAEHAPAVLNALHHFGTRLAGNALLGATYMPHHPVEGALTGAANPLMGAVGKGLVSVLPDLAKIGKFFLRPSMTFGTEISPEQLAENLRVTRGTETPLGDVINSPTLKRAYENILSRVPGSGAYSSMARTGKKIIEKGHNILDKLSGGEDPENFDQVLNESLQDEFEKHRTLKNNLYDTVNDLADKHNFRVEVPKFSNQAKNFKEALTQTNLLQFEPGAKSLINRLSRYSDSSPEGVPTPGLLVDESGQPLLTTLTKSPPTLREANLLKSNLSDLSARYGSSIDRSHADMARIFGKLSKSLKQDIEQNLEAKAPQELKDAYKTAQSNYAKNYSPFLDKDIYKYTQEDADANTLLSHFIKTGKSTDRVNLLNKLVTKLPADKQNLLGHAYLSRALDEGEILNPLKVKTLLAKNSLGKRQFKALFPDKGIQNQLRDYVKLAGKNTKALKAMENPETGQMVMDLLPSMLPTPVGAAALLAKVVGARYAVNRLTSESFREALAKKMLGNSLREGNPFSEGAPSPDARALTPPSSDIPQ